MFSLGLIGFEKFMKFTSHAWGYRYARKKCSIFDNVETAD